MFLICVSLVGCGRTAEPDSGGAGAAGKKPVVVCTLFPQYDFARTVFGDAADVVMILKPGMESHMFDPTPRDMVTISEADALIYTGDEMEPWAAEIVESLSQVRILDLSRVVRLEQEDHDHAAAEAESGEGSEAAAAEADHLWERHHDHEHSYDPHFWLDLDNARSMLEAIGDLAVEMGLDGETVAARVQDYSERLAALDEAYFEAVAEAAHRDIVFAGRFAYGYLVNRYGLDYETVYHTCAAEEDPSVYDMARVIDYIGEHQTKVIFYEELSSAVVAKTIAADTGVQIRMLSTAHNVSKEAFDAGITFYDIISNNLEVLREALE